MKSLESTLETYATIETPEQITLDVELAGIGSRFSAYAIDTLIQLVLIAAGAFAAVGFASAGGHAVTSKDPAKMYLTPLGLALLSLVVFFVNFGYFTLFEMIWRGQTPGKRRLGLRVIREGGYPLTFTASFLRNLIRVVDFLPFGYVVGTMAGVLGGRWQRLGDLAAGTWVVRETKAGESTWRADRDSDAELALDFLSRFEAGGSANWDLARKIAEGIAARRGDPAPSDFLDYLGKVGRAA